MEKLKRLKIIIISTIIFTLLVTLCIVLAVTLSNRQSDSANAVVGSGLGWADSDTSSGIYYIKNSSDFSSFRTAVSEGNNFLGCTVYQTASISLSSYAPVGTDATNCFNGTYDGQNFNLNLTNTASTHTYWGLFGYSTGCTIKNVRCTSMSYTNSTTSTGTSKIYAGFLLGYGDGNFTIQNCDATINLLYSKNSIRGSRYFGGLVGYIDGTVNMTGNKVKLVYTSQYNVIYTNIYSYTSTSFSLAGGLVSYMNITGQSYFNNNTFTASTGGINAYLNSNYSSSGSYKIGGGMGTQIGSVISSNPSYLDLYNLNSTVNYNCYASSGSIYGDLIVATGGLVGYMKNVSLHDCKLSVGSGARIYGVSSVGGFVGRSDGTAKIYNLDLDLNYASNMSVGGCIIGTVYDSIDIYNCSVDLNEENCITSYSSMGGIIGSNYGDMNIYSCMVSLNATNVIYNNSINYFSGILYSNLGNVNISKCYVGINSINAMRYYSSSMGLGFSGILYSIGSSTYNDENNYTANIEDCIINVTKTNGVNVYSIASGVGPISSNYGNIVVNISSCYVGGGGSITVNNGSIAGISTSGLSNLAIDNCMCSLTLKGNFGSDSKGAGIAPTAMVTNCIFTGYVEAATAYPLGANASGSLGYCTYKTGSSSSEIITYQNVDAQNLGNSDFLSMMGFDMQKWRSVENGGVSLIPTILTNIDQKLTITKFNYDFNKQQIEISYKTNGYMTTMTSNGQTVNLGLSGNGTIGVAEYTNQTVDGYVDIVISGGMMGYYQFNTLQSVTSNSPYASVYQANYSGQENAFLYEIKAIYAGGYYPKISINNSEFVEIDKVSRNEEVLGGCYYSCEFALGVFNLQVSGIGQANIVIDAYLYSEPDLTKKINVRMSGGSAQITTTYNENNSAEILVVPNTGYYVVGVVFGNYNVPIEYYQAQIVSAGSAKKIEYYAKDSTNIFYMTFEGIYADMDIQLVLLNKAPSLKVPPSNGSGGVLVSGTFVTATIGGEARITGNDIANGSDNDTVTFIAVNYKGYKFVGWKDSDNNILGTQSSIKLKKNQVNGKVITAVFEKISEDNTINDDLDDDIHDIL